MPAIYPDPADVRLGFPYGPNGDDYTGTAIIPTAPTLADSSPAADIAYLLALAGLGVQGAATGWSIQVGGFGFSPDQQIAVIDGAGLSPNPRWTLDQPAVQVLARGPIAADSYATAWAMALAVRETLLGKAPVTVNSTAYRGFTMRGDIGPLGPDENGREQFSLNFQLTAERPGGNRTAI